MSLFVRLETSFWTHRKTMRLKVLLGESALWLPLRLWSYAATHQQDGDFSGYSAEELAMLLGYSSNACSMLEALISTGFVDSDLKIHDWEAYNSYHVVFSERAKIAATARWEKARARKLKKEAKKEITGEEKRGEETSIASSMLVASVAPLPLGVRISNLFHRRHDTIWSDKERTAFKKVEAMNIPESDISTLETYYQSGAPYIRRDILTLLNNFPGEIDRAREFKNNPQSFLKNGHQTLKPNPRNAGVLGADTAGADAKRAVQAMEAKRRASYAMAAQVPEGPPVVPSESSGNGHGGGDVLLSFCEKPSQ